MSTTAAMPPPPPPPPANHRPQQHPYSNPHSQLRRSAATSATSVSVAMPVSVSVPTPTWSNRQARALALSEKIRALAQSLRLHEPSRIAEYVTYLHPAASQPQAGQVNAPARVDQPEHFVAAQPSPPLPHISASSSGPSGPGFSPNHLLSNARVEDSTELPKPPASRIPSKRVREVRSRDESPSYLQSKRVESCCLSAHFLGIIHVNTTQRRSSQSPQPHNKGGSSSNFVSGERDSGVDTDKYTFPDPTQRDSDLQARVDSCESIKSYRKADDTNDRKESAVLVAEEISGSSSIRSTTDCANVLKNGENSAQQPPRVQIVERRSGGATLNVSPKLNGGGKDVLALKEQSSYVHLLRPNRIIKVVKDEKRSVDASIGENNSNERNQDGVDLSRERERERNGSHGKNTSRRDSSRSRSRSRSLERGRPRETRKRESTAYANNDGSPDRRPRPRMKDEESKRQGPGGERSKSRSPSQSASPSRKLWQRNRNFKTPDREQTRGGDTSKDGSSTKKGSNSVAKSAEYREPKRLSRSPRTDPRQSIPRGNESPCSPPLPLPVTEASSAKKGRYQVGANKPEMPIPATTQPVTPSQPVKKVSLSEYSSKLRNSTTVSPNTAHAKFAEQSTSTPPPPLATTTPSDSVAASSVRLNSELSNSKLNWKNLVAIHKHQGDELRLKPRTAGSVASDPDSLLIVLNYCTSVFYSLLETGTDDSHIAKTHIHSESLLQFVLKSLSKMKLNEIYSLMHVATGVSAFAQRLQESSKKAKSLTAFMSQQRNDTFENALGFGGANNGSDSQHHFGLLKDVLQSALDMDADSRKAEHSWTLADKLCADMRDAFPAATQKSGGFVITLYSEYKELSDYGVRCLQDYAERHGVEEFCIKKRK
ncbi:hypothetical protein HDU82_003992 [Entophlyctis luteolus]|nr:hypothetical protein HDU82_003992 [Entophlyctis luteolus]